MTQPHELLYITHTFSLIMLLVLIELFAVVLNKHDFQMMRPFGLSCSSKTIFRWLIG